MNFRRIFIFGLWLALGVVGIGIVLPELNRARSGSDQTAVFENIASELPAMAEGSPDNSEAISDFFSSPTGAASGSSNESLGLSGIGQGGGGTTTGLGMGIGPMGNGAASASAPRMEAAAPEPAPRAAMSVPMMSETPEESASESEDMMAALDRKLASLPLANIAFNTPETIPLGDDAMIELLLSLQETQDQLREAVRAAGPVESARIQITDQMEARLTGLGFRIESITPERQAVSRAQRTGWRWQIEPTKSDTLELHLTLSAIVTIDGVPAPRTVQTFERTIYVEVPLATQVTQFAKNNVEIITTFFLIPVVGGLYRHVRKKKRQDAMPEFDERPRRAA